jgi:signal transduction histidine kinase
MDSSRARLVVSIAVVAGATVIFAVAGYLIDQKIVQVLDARLGGALVAQAQTIAASVEFPESDDAISLALTVAGLTDVRLAGDLQVVALFDAMGNLLAADPPALGTASYLLLDNAVLADALSGSAAYGERYTIGGNDLRSAFAPVFDRYRDIVGAVGIEAPAGFFGALGEVRIAIAATLLIGMLIVVGLTVIVWRFWAKSERSERAMFRSQQLATIGQMTATMAHEVRNPLSIIRATAERIRKKFGDGTEVFDFIPEEVDRLDRITRWYLDFARPTDVAPGPVDVVAVFDNAVTRLRKEIETQGIEVVRPDENTSHVIADRDRLLQAMLNIVLNSTEAMTEGGKLELRIVGHPTQVRIEIVDDGPGIPADILHSAFSPFFTTKTTGSGLGLAVVQQVAQEVGGTAGIDSEMGHGTTVWLELRKNHA